MRPKGNSNTTSPDLRPSSASPTRDGTKCSDAPDNLPPSVPMIRAPPPPLFAPQTRQPWIRCCRYPSSPATEPPWLAEQATAWGNPPYLAIAGSVTRQGYGEYRSGQRFRITRFGHAIDYPPQPNSDPTRPHCCCGDVADDAYLASHRR